MKAVFLNTWYGKLEEPFFDFIEKEKGKTDFFCFLEVHPQLFKKMQKNLSGFEGIYASDYKMGTIGFTYGQAIFVRKGIKFRDPGKINLCRNHWLHAGSMQYLNFEVNKKKIFLGSVHGLSVPGTKVDTLKRLIQSFKIIKFFKGKKRVIVGGDFNLMPETKSVGIFSFFGYRNLIKDFKISQTRSKTGWEYHLRNNPGISRQYFADYVFVSKEIKVKGFQVPQLEISDHLPLILEFEV